VKALFVLSAALTILPFIPWENYLSHSVETGATKQKFLQKVVVDDLPQYGAAAGVAVNVNDLTTFPPNSHWVFTFPTSGDPSLDAQNPDTFLKYELIRLPTELGGASKLATDFVAFSKVCVHLWCSPNYNPAPGHMQYECPCHGSIYRIPDGLAIGGPASLQPPPTNAIPMATLQADSAGNLYVFASNYDPTTEATPASLPAGVNPTEGDGTLGYGRDYLSYDSFVKRIAQAPANPDDLTKVVPS
jgi:Rieske Fe-S protein